MQLLSACGTAAERGCHVKQQSRCQPLRDVASAFRRTQWQIESFGDAKRCRRDGVRGEAVSDSERRLRPLVDRRIPDGNRRWFIGRRDGRLVHVIDVFVRYDGCFARLFLFGFAF